ncbi:MAG: DUF2075 domain-containing protein [Bacteroidales bacterium]|nr:DUF2075 domain-containing protein [Bacteroidales bacterium]
MLIYQGNTAEFCELDRMNKLADKMNKNFYYYSGRKAGLSEYHSWQNSLSRLRDIIEISGIKDTHIALEYFVPYNDQSRIDCLLYGKDENSNDNILLIELKQWDLVESTSIEGNFVETFTGGAKRRVPHPAQQVKGYHNYLLEFVEEFEAEPPLRLTSCSYCHNYSKEDKSGLFDTVYSNLLSEFPVYCKEDVNLLSKKLKELLQKGSGTEIFNRFMTSRIRPSKKLLDNIKDVIVNGKQYALLNEQLLARNLIRAKIKQAEKHNKKSIIIVKGGPGTGKSIIALNVIADLARRQRSTLLVCKSKPFREGLQNFVGSKFKNLFISPYFLVPERIKENSLDVILVDEAHRIEEKNVNRYMKKEQRSDLSQLDQIIRSAKTSVFFIDDNQRVRKQEIGSSESIIQAAEKISASVDEVQLLSQFRCMGSNDYLLWIESVLGHNDESRILKKNNIFDFAIYDSPELLYGKLKEKEAEKPNSARLVAGYCWPWNDPKPDGTLVNDVKIGNFEMPWETKGEHGAGHYPAWYHWAFKPNGFEQVGCIYTAQGFEFDYIGVIIGNDLKFNPVTDLLEGNIAGTADPTLKSDSANFDKYVRNIYRVLLTRGMKGCYVYFVNKEIEQYFRKRIEE